MALIPGKAAWGQLAPPNEAGVAMGHLEFVVQDVDSYRKFFMTLGAVPAAHGNGNAVKFPGAVFLIKKGEPSGGTLGSVVNHVGLIVPNESAALAKWKDLGIKTEAGTHEGQGFVYSPDGLVKIEILEDKTQTVPVAFHHIHFFVPDPGPGGGSGVLEMQAWYSRIFGAIPGKRAIFDAAALPGVSLTFSKSDTPTVPTKGRALDNIGFEIKDLQGFCKKETELGVKFDSPCTAKRVWLTDPWGTSIELTNDMDMRSM
jgi:catechol 2,3-dioxygenase-like lactoylglutathione lyase family enzyme